MENNPNVWNHQPALLGMVTMALGKNHIVVIFYSWFHEVSHDIPTIVPKSIPSGEENPYLSPWFCHNIPLWITY